MFKKLKDKIAEEVKSSPQKLQQITKSVTNSTSENMFSIDEENAVNTYSSSPVPSSYRSRRDSNSSFASDVSFLTCYESPGNSYHLQSDLDVSASEVEDISGDKNQIIASYKNIFAKYNKYRGRYTDLTHHYKSLERENAKIKAILVETQDKAFRRVSELKEQCTLEQNAKAHIEQVLREDLNEQQILINTLNQKIQLLQSDKKEDDDTNSMVQQLRRKNEELEEKLKGISETHSNEMEVFKDTTKKKIIEMWDKHQSLLNQMAEKTQEIDRLREIYKENSDLETLQKLLLSLEEENNELSNKVKDFEKMQSKVNDLTAELKAAKVIQTESEDKFKQVIHHLELSNKEMLNKLEEAEKLQEKIDDLVAELRASKLILNETEESFKKIEQKYSSKEVEYNDLSDKFRSIMQEKEVLQQQVININNLNEELLKLKTDNKNLNEQLTLVKQDLITSNSEYTKKDNNFLENLQKLLIKVGVDNNTTDKFILIKEIENIINDKDDMLNKSFEEINNLLKLSEEKHNALANSLEEQNKLNKELENLKQALNEKQNSQLNNELQQELDKTIKQCEQQQMALKNLELEKTNLLKKVDSLMELVQDSKTSLLNITNEKDRLNEEIIQLRQSFENLVITASEKEKLSVENAELKRILKEKIDALSKEEKSNNNLNNKLEQLQLELSELRIQEKHFKEEINKFQSLINEKEITIQKNNEKYSLLKKEQNELLSNKIKELKDSLLEKDKIFQENLAKYNILESKYHELDALFNEKETFLIKSNEELCVVMKQNEEVQERSKNLMENLKKFEEENVQNKNLITILTDEKNYALKQNMQLLETQEKIKEELNNLKQDLFASEEEIEKLNLEINNFKQTSHLNELKEIDKLKEELILLKTAENNVKLELTKSLEDKSNLNIYIENMKKTLTEQESELLNVSNENNLLHEEIKILKHEKENSSSISINNYSEINEKLQRKIHLLNDAEEKLLVFTNQIKNLENKNLELTKELDVLKSDSKNQISSSETAEKVDEFIKQISQLENKNAELLKELEEIRKLHNIQNNETEKYISLHNEALQNINDLNDNMERLTTECNSNVQYYQNEIIKLQNKNEKLESRLDETIVTLNHCTELSSSSTEMEYLKNILYNYMMGKESVVLARVIAAVCKFDQTQTEAVLQKEQQKQTLLGHLGLA